MKLSLGWGWCAAALVALGADAREYGALPLAFQPNTGELPAEIAFVGRGRGATFFLGRGEAIATFPGSSKVLRLRWVGASSVAPRGRTTLPGTMNVFRGNDPTRWQTGLPTWAEVVYPDLYPGIDLVFDGRGGEVEFNFELRPGADPGLIRFQVDGADVRRQSGALALRLGDRTLFLRAPRAVQRGREVAAAYQLGTHGRVAIALGPHERGAPLVIDPLLAYSTYLGGLGADVIDAIAVDSAGNTYLAGSTTSPNFPTKGSLEPLDGGADAFVAELDPAGNALVFSTYLGGSQEDGANAIAVDSQGGIYVTGGTSSANFPVVSPVQANWKGEIDAFVTKLQPGGSRIAYSTYLGSPNEDYGNAIAVDSRGDAFITGCVSGTPGFPSWNSFRSLSAGNWDSFVTELDPNGQGFGSTTFSTFVGGSNVECGEAIGLDGAGNIYVAGNTQSSDFPTASPLRAWADGGQDGFVFELASGGQSFVYSSYLGGAGYDEINALVVADGGALYVAGSSGSPDLPTTPGVIQPRLSPGRDAFLARIAPGGSAIDWMTYLGQQAVIRAMALNPAGYVYVAGGTSSNNFPLSSSLQARSGNSDAFLSVLNPSATGFAYSTLLGGSANDNALALALDESGHAFIAGTTTSLDFPPGPPTSTPFQNSFGTKSADGGTTDGFLARIDQPPPSVTSIVPDAGPITGGTTVTLNGQNFLVGARVLFGKEDAGSVTRTSPGNLSAVTPPHDAGTVDVTVINPDGQMTTVPQAFTFFGPQAVVTPAQLTVDAGVAFTLDGTHSTASPGATLTAFEWSEPAGPAAAALDAGPQLALTLDQPGSYVFTLVVQDSAGVSSLPATAEVRVNGGAPELPPYRFGCGCEGASAAPIALALLAITAAARGRRASARARRRS